jgi:hypothetical protein
MEHFNVLTNLSDPLKMPPMPSPCRRISYYDETSFMTHSHAIDLIDPLRLTTNTFTESNSNLINDPLNIRNLSRVAILSLKFTH